MTPRSAPHPHEYTHTQTEINIRSRPGPTFPLGLTGTITACGNHLNDLLFAVAAHNVALANVHPTVLPGATTTTVPNATDDVISHLLTHHP